MTCHLQMRLKGWGQVRSSIERVHRVNVLWSSLLLQLPTGLNLCGMMRAKLLSPPPEWLPLIHHPCTPVHIQCL
jgi:hypothetical protein